MNKGEKELVKLTEKWMNKIQEVTSGYEKAIATLDQIRTDVEKQKKSWYQILLPYLPYIFPLVLLGACFLFIRYSGCISLKLAGLEITCPK